MIEIRKLIVCFFVLILFVYMIAINFKVFNKFGNKRSLSAFMISGLGLIFCGTFFDLISNLINVEFKTLIYTCFTAGTVIFVLYIILWSNYIIRIMNKLDKGAHNDVMTGLYNRVGFEKVLTRKMQKKKPFYIIVFDLDKTKHINDNFGHLKGDEYIIKTAKIIKNTIGENGFVGRTGGDEFVAFIENINEAEMENIKVQIKKRVSNIFSNQSTQVSVGYSRYKRDGKTFEELLAFADEEMYQNKRTEKGIFYIDKGIMM